MKKRKEISFSCDFCKSTQFRDATQKLNRKVPGFQVVECKDCGLTCLNTAVEEHKLKKFYQNYKNQAERVRVECIREKNIYPEKLKQLKRLTIGRKMLDIGAGLGTFASLAQKNGFNVTGVELSKSQCEYAKKKYDIDLINQNMFEIHEHIGTFDVIHLHHVMEHLRSPQSMFEIVHNYLNPDGVLLIEVPFQLERIQDKIKKMVARFHILDNLYQPIAPKPEMAYPLDHLFFFTPKTMERYLKKNGFKSIKVQQHRNNILSNTEDLSPLKYIKMIFYKVSTTMKLPSGAFLEFYCRKSN